MCLHRLRFFSVSDQFSVPKFQYLLISRFSTPQCPDGSSDVDVDDENLSPPARHGDPLVVVTEPNEADVLSELDRLSHLSALQVPDLRSVVQGP